MIFVDIQSVRSALEHGTGEGVKVAVIDSGVDWDHPMFEDFLPADDLIVSTSGYEIRPPEEGEGGDKVGHGTAVASIIHHLSPKAQLGSFKVLGTRLGNRERRIGLAFREAIERGYHVINCSFGSRAEAFITFYKKLVDLAVLKEVHVVASVNDTDDQRQEWPAYFSSVFGVRAGTREDNRIRAVGYSDGDLIEFVAPGENLSVAWPGGFWKRVSGGSFATACFSGKLACLLSQKPDLTPLEARLLLRRAYR